MKKLLSGFALCFVLASIGCVADADVSEVSVDYDQSAQVDNNAETNIDQAMNSATSSREFEVDYAVEDVVPIELIDFDTQANAMHDGTHAREIQICKGSPTCLCSDGIHCSYQCCYNP